MPKFYRKEEVEANQFNGWADADILWYWTNGMVLYVPKGYDHSLRRKNEYPLLGGIISKPLPDAVEFLAVRMRKEDLLAVDVMRMDVGDWLVQDEERLFSVVEKQEFFQKYDGAGL